MFTDLTTTKTRPGFLASFLFLGILSTLAGCSPGEPERDSLRLSGETMGTFYHITLVSDAGETLDHLDESALADGIDAELEAINQSMSTYIDDSELVRFNQSPVGEWQSLSEPLARVLALSQSVSRASDGAFDVTVGPLVDLWGFGPEAEPESIPSDERIEAVRAQMGHEHLTLENQRARREKDVRLDLSAVAKGYGVDHLADWLEARGVENYMVEIGGEVRLAGDSPRGDRWRIAVEQPSLLRKEGEGRLVLALSDRGMATSGDYRNYYERDGRRYSHTIDPRTGKPIRHKLVSVTVLADTAAEADAWSTAFNVLGPERGMALAEREKLPVYMIVKAGESFEDRHSSAFEPWMEKRDSANER